MSNQHTPGPWIVNDCTSRAGNGTSQYRYRITVEEGRDAEEIASVHTHSYLVPEPGCVHEANANLIAAAPELLAALRELLAWAERSPDPTETDEPSQFHNARAAIAKATEPQS